MLIIFAQIYTQIMRFHLLSSHTSLTFSQTQKQKKWSLLNNHHGCTKQFLNGNFRISCSEIKIFFITISIRVATLAVTYDYIKQINKIKRMILRPAELSEM
ncbi:hypothetical protein XENOCAPTIV_014144 [Xenoophorus captivus]|uniref:Uncharacterized protein n=1 Tax=Xenoophorus captivus TaxID=1517983 RepID=A0ABV0QVI5_9TELE